jgi:peptidoglycan/LPS O-acetylase OafA/YrhL
MIQRVQTIFLFVVVVCMVLALFLPTWQKASADSNEIANLNFFNLSYQKEKSPAKTTATFYLAILAVTAALTAGYSIFRYDNRRLQMGLGLLNSLLMIGVLALMVYFSFSGEKLFQGTQKGVYQIGFFMPVLALLSNLLANRFIKKDEMLVKSMDRMR